jgi:hypothetical protein
MSEKNPYLDSRRGDILDSFDNETEDNNHINIFIPVSKTIYENFVEGQEQLLLKAKQKSTSWSENPFLDIKGFFFFFSYNDLRRFMQIQKSRYYPETLEDIRKQVRRCSLEELYELDSFCNLYSCFFKVLKFSLPFKRSSNFNERTENINTIHVLPLGQESEADDEAISLNIYRFKNDKRNSLNIPLNDESVLNGGVYQVISCLEEVAVSENSTPLVLI